MTSKTQIGTRVIFSFLLVIGLVLTNCSDTNLSPLDNNTETNVSDLRAKKGGVPAGLIPNSQRYNDTSLPSASGRDGEVTVTARAMIDVDGNTTLEVTTAALDSDNRAPGTITKQQVKALDLENPDSDNPVWVENYNRLRDGGYFTASYPGLERGQQLALHTNVKGIIKGTAVVFVDETIKARPDLTVSAIDAPTEVNVGDPVTILADVTELNGDLGATMDCVLSIDGQDEAAAYGIWVDSGDTVGCVFEELFDTPGEKNVIVRVDNITPGDYDNSNNQLYTTITVIEENNGGEFLRWSSSFTYWEYNNIDVNLTYSENINFSVNGVGIIENWEIPEFIEIGVYSDQNELLAFNMETFGRPFNAIFNSSGFSYYQYSGTTLNFFFSVRAYRQVYFSRDMFGDVYISRENSYGVVPDKSLIGDDIEFAVDFGSADLTGGYPVMASTYGTEYRISGYANFY